MGRPHRTHGKRSRRSWRRVTSAPRPALAATAPSALDRLLPEAATLSEAGRHQPPALIVEGPEGAKRRRARDERDGVEVADPRPRMLYVGIAVFVALLVFAVLGLIESR